MITEKLRQCNIDDKVKAVLVYGAGGNLSSGFDIRGFNNPATRIQHLKTDADYVQFLADYTMAWTTLQKPLIFLVQGCAVGIIASHVAAADFAICTDDAFFVLPFGSIGFTPEDLSSVRFSTLFGPKLSTEILLLDKRVTAQEALNHGLVNYVIPAQAAPSTEPILTDFAALP